jgi:hypothetical protein
VYYVVSLCIVQGGDFSFILFIFFIGIDGENNITAILY